MLTLAISSASRYARRQLTMTSAGVTQPPWVEPEQALRHKSTRGGEVAIWFPAPRVIVYKYRGYTDASHARFIEKTFDDAFGPDERNIHLFVDTEGQTGYDPEFRRLTGLRFNRIRHQTETYCLLVKSRIISLGLYLVAFIMKVPSVTGFSTRISAVADRELFHSRIETAVRRSLAPDAP